MLVVFIILYIATIIAFFCFKKLKQSILKILSYLCMIVILVVFYIYWVKVGGFIPSQQKIIFGSSSIISFVKYIYVKTNTLAMILSASRLLFPLIILIDALQINFKSKNFLAKRKYLYFILCLPIVAAFILTVPEIFMEIFAHNFFAQEAMVFAVNFMIVSYLACSMCLYIFELFDISLYWFKQRHKYLIISSAATIFQFGYFMGFEPVSIFQDYDRIYYISNFLRNTSAESIAMWVVVLAICILTTLLAMWQLYKFTKFDYDREKQELVISKAVSGVSLPISTIVHGVKNQIIASKILSENAMDALNDDNKAEAVKMVGKLQSINDIILNRMDYLYKSFKTLQTVLVLTDVKTVIDSVKIKVGNIIPETQITYNIIDDRVIADVELLSEAVYNFVINAFEAVPLSRTPVIVVDTYVTRAHVVITIEDNGCGISKTVQEKLFEPFVSNKNSDKNWGLGLCNARKIVVNHLGYVRFDTQENIGTKFYIVLPNYKQKKENKR